MSNNFRSDLAYSDRMSDDAFWDGVYRKAFPNLVNHMKCEGDTKSQRMGIDRAVFLANGKTLYIDEKKRRENYPDVLLEYLSNDRTGAPGWMEKDLAIDYLAYAFMPSKRAYLFPWPMLCRVWLSKGTDWKRKYPIIKSENPGYFTHGVAVPTDILQRHVATAWIIQL